MAADQSRFGGVTALGVDEHVRHHVSTKPVEDGGRGDLKPGRSGAVYADWLKERNEAFRVGIKVATLDPFQGYKNALDDELEDAIAVLDAFHVVKLGTAAMDEVRRRVQQQTLGHRGRKGDPLYGIQNTLRCGAERLTDKQKNRLEKPFEVDTCPQIALVTMISHAPHCRYRGEHHRRPARRRTALADLAGAARAITRSSPAHELRLRASGQHRSDWWRDRAALSDRMIDQYDRAAGSGIPGGPLTR